MKTESARLVDWLTSSDTGASSKAIAMHMTGRKSSGDFPWDAADFGRCHRLLTLFPEWRQRLPEMAAAFPAWRKLVDVWPELEALYKELGRENSYVQITNKMRKAKAAAAKKDGWIALGPHAHIRMGE